MSIVISDYLKEIRQSFRLIMNGEAAQSMREKGLSYRVNWGASVGDLQTMADDIISETSEEERLDLAKKLWQDNVRESKLIAIMIMPIDKCDESIVEEWTKNIPTIEIAEALAYYLLQHTDNNNIVAIRLIDSGKEYSQLCGLHAYNRFLSKSGIKNISENMRDKLYNLINDTTQTLAIRKAALSIITKTEE